MARHRMQTCMRTLACLLCLHAREIASQNTGRPTTGLPATGAPTTGDPAVWFPGTGEPTTGAPTTGAPTTGAPPTPAPPTAEPSTGNPAVPGSTGVLTTAAPPTWVPGTTPAPPTTEPSTGEPTTGGPTTGTPSAFGVVATTGRPTTGRPTTGVPNTVAPPTLNPTPPSSPDDNATLDVPGTLTNTAGDATAAVPQGPGNATATVDDGNMTATGMGSGGGANTSSTMATGTGSLAKNATSTPDVPTSTGVGNMTTTQGSGHGSDSGNVTTTLTNLPVSADNVTVTGNPSRNVSAGGASDNTTMTDTDAPSTPPTPGPSGLDPVPNPSTEPNTTRTLGTLTGVVTTTAGPDNTTATTTTPIPSPNATSTPQPPQVTDVPATPEPVPPPPTPGPSSVATDVPVTTETGTTGGTTEPASSEPATTSPTTPVPQGLTDAPGSPGPTPAQVIPITMGYCPFGYKNTPKYNDAVKNFMSCPIPKIGDECRVSPGAAFDICTQLNDCCVVVQREGDNETYALGGCGGDFFTLNAPYASCFKGGVNIAQACPSGWVQSAGRPAGIDLYGTCDGSTSTRHCVLHSADALALCAGDNDCCSVSQGPLVQPNYLALGSCSAVDVMQGSEASWVTCYYVGAPDVATTVPAKAGTPTPGPESVAAALADDGFVWYDDLLPLLIAGGVLVCALCGLAVCYGTKRQRLAAEAEHRAQQDLLAALACEEDVADMKALDASFVGSTATPFFLHPGAAGTTFDDPAPMTPLLRCRCGAQYALGTDCDKCKRSVTSPARLQV